MTTTQPATHLEREVASQPDAWRTVVGRAAGLVDLLPAPGERVAVVGAHLLFVAQAYAGLRESPGRGVTDAWPASEHRIGRGSTRCSPSPVGHHHQGGRAARGPARLTAPDRRHRRPRPRSSTSPRPSCWTRSTSVGGPDPFATATLALLRASLGHDLEPASADAESVLASARGPSRRALTASRSPSRRGWTVGLAHEAALKLREAAQVWTESYPAMETRRGPISIATAERLTWALGEVPPGLGDDVPTTGAASGAARSTRWPTSSRCACCASRTGRRGGSGPDFPRHLSGSIILDR